MAHFAKLDSNNVVIDVVVVNNLDCFDFDNGCEREQMGIEYCQQLFNDYSSRWIQSSYTGRIRGNHASVGFTYDEELDVFLKPKPFESWVLNTTTWDWDAPIPMTDDDNIYYWDEDLYQQDNTQGWVAFTRTPDDQVEPSDEEYEYANEAEE